MTPSRAIRQICAAECVTRQSSVAFHGRNGSIQSARRLSAFGNFHEKEQIAVRGERVGLRRFYDAVNHGTGSCAAGRIVKQEVLAPHHKRLDTPFDTAVADFEASIQQVIRQRRLLVRQTDERLTEL